MAVNKGGRGLKAPYETTHVRVPVPIKDKVQQLIDDYKNNQISDVKETLDFEAAVSLARDVLKDKKSARASLQKLLTGIYGKDITL